MRAAPLSAELQRGEKPARETLSQPWRQWFDELVQTIERQEARIKALETPEGG